MTNTPAAKRTQTTSHHDATGTVHPRKKKQRIKRYTRRRITTEQTGSLPSTIHPNLQGIITIIPPSLWKSLNLEHQTWVLDYNAAVRHDEKTPPPPKGIHVSSPTDDGNGNKGIPGSRRSSKLDIDLTADNYYTLTTFEPN